MRVGVIRDWDAKWYAEKEYADYLHEDLAIRNLINTKLADASVSTIEVERAVNKVIVTLHTAKPGMVIGKSGANVDALRAELNKLTGKQVHINIVEIKKNLIWTLILLVLELHNNLKHVLLSVVLKNKRFNALCVQVLKGLKLKYLVV